MKPLLWAELTWQQLCDVRAEGVNMAILPLGATAQHGPHLPLNASLITSESVAHAVSARTGVPVLPALPFGCSARHTRKWPGTLSLSHNTLLAVVCDVLEDVLAYGFNRLLILSAEPGNAAPLDSAIDQLRRSHHGVQLAHKHLAEASPRVRAAYEADGAGGHANAAETALMLHLAPRLVHGHRIVDEPRRANDTVFSYTTPQVSQSGVLGSPSQATFEMGQELFEALVTDWTYLVKRALIEKPPMICEEAAKPAAAVP